jgi:anti-sigma factor RsiW
MTSRQEDGVEPTPDQQSLVAYLDGELDADNTRRVEARLAEDNDYRQLLQQLQRSWDLLDDLPQQGADEVLTRTTVEMVALKTANEVQQQQPQLTRRRRTRQILMAGVGLTGLLLGYFGIQSWLDRPNRKFLEDLPVIERVDLYEYVDELAFLEALAEEGLFDEDVDTPLPAQKP